VPFAVRGLLAGLGGPLRDLRGAGPSATEIGPGHDVGVVARGSWLSTPNGGPIPRDGGCLEHSLSAGIILLSRRGVDHSACCELNFLFKLPKTVGLQPFYQKSGRKFRLPLIAHRRRIPEK
jgi:hypothetical protein